MGSHLVRDVFSPPPPLAWPHRENGAARRSVAQDSRLDWYGVSFGGVGALRRWRCQPYWVSCGIPTMGSASGSVSPVVSLGIWASWQDHEQDRADHLLGRSKY